MKVYIVQTDEGIDVFKSKKKAQDLYDTIIGDILFDENHWEDKYETDLEARREVYEWYLSEDVQPIVVEFYEATLNEDMSMETEKNA